MKIAIVGCGAEGHIHASRLQQISQVELVGCWDEQQQASKELAEKHGMAAFAAFEQMMTQGKPDAVSLCLPASSHKEVAVKAAQYGKHVICTAPIAKTLEDAQEMIAACRSNGVRLIVTHTLRRIPNYANVQREIAAGAIGKVGVAHLKRTGPYSALEAGDAEDSSVITDWLISEIDFIRSVLGEVKSVYTLNRKTDQHDYALVTLTFHSGAIANLEGYLGHPEPLAAAADFAGKGGIIRFDSKDLPAIYIRKMLGGNRNGALAAQCIFDKARIVELNDLVDCVRQEKELAADADDAFKALEIALAAVRSAQTGVPVRIGNDAAHSGGNMYVS